MDTDREHDEFERIKLTAELEWRRRVVAQYVEGLGKMRRKIEDRRYRLGELDERLRRSA